ncbi:aldehyde dehydrogenase family protein [Nocardia sp. XZ_19_369]|uniref:aldehyde dehydrogenase family protein n=1 Tax=Nocardia sp. XZ_19_369 TaxID=2769487 RepID=UPI00188FC3DB|nr:aldehyde dehydrogenase family protein [Nocardia sp. XZ_19_369]
MTSLSTPPLRNDADFERIIETACSTAALIECRRDRIREVLTPIATLDSIDTEIADSIGLLRTAGLEYPAYRAGDPDSQVRVFLPANNLLYSMALFVALPSLYLGNVLARPASRVKDAYLELAQLLSDGPIDIGGRMRTYSQSTFADISQGSVVVFSGKPENGRQVDEECDSGLFLGFGTGINPIVIGRDLSGPDLSGAVQATVAARLYNNGQDCLCPDAIFVDAAVADDFVAELVRRLGTVPVVSTGAVAGLISAPLADTATYDRAMTALDEFDSSVVWSGKTSAHQRHCPTAVSVRRLPEVPAAVPELFGPLFNVVVYDRIDEVLDFLGTPETDPYGMYISVFGVAELVGVGRVGSARNTGARTAFDFENGHEPFGGFGPNGTVAAGAGREPVGRPLLLAAELARYAAERGEVDATR